jgi:hypothetical protein
VACCFATATAVQQGLLRGRGVGGVALEQDLAADAMQFCFERAKSRAVDSRQRFVDDRESAIGIARPRFDLSQRNLDEPVENQDILFAQQVRAAAHVLDSVGVRAARSGRPTLQKHP